MQVSAAQRATRGVQKKLDLEMAALEEAREDGEGFKKEITKLAAAAVLSSSLQALLDDKAKQIAGSEDITC
jgi:hypothetical protein